MKDNNAIRLYGSTVFLRDGDDVNRALRKFKNKIEDSNKLNKKIYKKVLPEVKLDKTTAS
jgi:ribosomal protein S21